MNTSPLTRISVFTFGLALAHFAQATALYEVVQIGNWPGTPDGAPMAINNRNHVLGNSWANGENMPWIWTEGEGMSGFGFGSQPALTVRDFNNFGTAAGHYESWNSAVRTVPGSIFGWGVPNGYTSSSGWGINDLGAVVGYATNANNISRAYRFNANFTSTALPTLNANVDSKARRVNTAGTVVGVSDDKAVLWTANNTLVNLHAMLPNATRSFASDINEAGWVTGYFQNGQGQFQGFLFNFEAGMSTFSPVGSDSFVVSRAINLHGDTVGISNDSENGGQLRGFFRRNGGPTVSLNDLIQPNSGWNLDQATDINDNGYIVGVGRFQGVRTNFLMKPVPEPASMLVLGAGVAALLRRRRRTAG